MKAAILQPNYIPWIGYFEIIKNCQVFVFYNDTQYTKRDWRNRNYINLNKKKHLLSVPVLSKGNFYKNINQIKFADRKFLKNHLEIISHAYSKTKCYNDCMEFIKDIFKSYKGEYLSEFNIHLTKKICDYLNIKSKFIVSSDLNINSKSNEKLIEICKKINCDEYISGMNSLNYIDEKLFLKNGISLNIISYKQQINYNIDKSKFLKKLSIIDLIFNQGKNSHLYLQDLDLISFSDAQNLFLKKNE